MTTSLCCFHKFLRNKMSSFALTSKGLIILHYSRLIVDENINANLTFAVAVKYAMNGTVLLVLVN